MPKLPLLSLQKKFTATIFAFYRAHGRSMPWRNTRDPYRIMVSEIMLQQTQVDRVREKYVEFLKAFPTIQKLGEASLGDVLRAWSGLGYNRRAKYLWLAAKQIMREYKGKFPKTMADLTTLSGIGPSTAAGVMAFAYNKPEPMIDTNVRRVLTRVFFLKQKKSDRELYLFAKTLIPEGRGREWNYALLDVAALKCTARNHAADCPLTKLHGKVGDVVKKYPQKRFADSDRYYRGRILELLRKEKDGVSLAALLKTTQTDGVRIRGLLDKLGKEGLLIKKGSRFVLP